MGAVVTPGEAYWNSQLLLLLNQWKDSASEDNAFVEIYSIRHELSTKMQVADVASSEIQKFKNLGFTNDFDAVDTLHYITLENYL